MYYDIWIVAVWAQCWYNYQDGLCWSADMKLTGWYIVGHVSTTINVLNNFFKIFQLVWHFAFFLFSGEFDEDFSDRCMTELMGSDGHARCEISEECLHTMSAPGYGDYGITHQLLYTILAEQVQPQPSKHIPHSNTLLSGIISQMEKHSQWTNIPNRKTLQMEKFPK